MDQITIKHNEMTPEQKAQEYAQKLWDDGFFMTKDILSDAHLAGQQSALEWIPVTPETMPPKDSEFLVVYKKTTAKQGTVYIGHYEEHGEIVVTDEDGNKMYHGNAGNFHGGDMYFFTDWMPLPQPPVKQ